MFQRFHNRCIQAYSISGVYPRMNIHYPIPIISLIYNNWSKILKVPVPVHVDAHIMYVNILYQGDEYKKEYMIDQCFS